MSEQPPDLDLGAPHLRPALHGERHPPSAPRPAPADRLPWESRGESVMAAAFFRTWWRFARTPAAAWAAVRERGEARPAVTFALLCGAVFGVASELVDSSTVALLRYGDVQGAAQVFQLDIAGRSLDWLPISLLSAAGCLLALLIVAPLFILLYGTLVLAWSAIVHGLLKLAGGLAGSRTGYRGTLRAVCYSQTAMAAAVLPWIGDPIAGIWSFWLQVPGLERLHGCRRAQAALAVGLPAGLLIIGLVLLVLFGESQAIAG